MSVILSLLVLVFPTIFAADVVVTQLAPCQGGLNMGTLPCKAKPSLRFHLDRATLTCMAFEYTGCGGNTNNYETEGGCYRDCLPIDHTNCPAASKPVKEDICHQDSECGANGYCSYGNGFGICCDKKIRDKLNADYKPKCPKGKKVYEFQEGGLNNTLVGKNCKSKFCPVGATCVEGTYLATCCK